jgi:transcriptional regulator with XRE-family HTH domain
MEPQQPVLCLTDDASAPVGEDVGSIVRSARLRAGLTLAELGDLCGYSASQVSRYERGVQQLTDVKLLRRFAKVLAIPYEMFGLTDPDQMQARRHADTNRPVTPACGPKVGRDFRREDGDDPVRRREWLAAAAGLTSAAFIPAAIGRSVSVNDRSVGLENLLYGSTATPVPVPALRAAIAARRQEFRTARYDRLLEGLPRLIGAASATYQCAEASQQGAVSSLLAEAYIVAVKFVVKLNDDPLALTLADRAFQSAAVGDDPLTLVDARRAVATVLRRTGRRAKAQDLLLSAARDLVPTSHTSPEQLSVYGTLLEAAAYTAAVDGDRSAASEYIGEAQAAAKRLGRDANYRYTTFGPASVTLYHVSIAQVLGDSGTAIQYAKTLTPGAILTAERRGRYWIDVARAYYQWKKPEPCYRALLAAERAAPAEVCYRPPVHRMTEDLLKTGCNSLPGVRDFARRIGLPAI